MANPAASNGTSTYQPPRTSRPKRPPTGDEEAGATLRLGEFQGVPSLNLSEARTIINAVTSRRKAMAAAATQNGGAGAAGTMGSRAVAGAGLASNETTLKVQEYLDMFARYKQQEHVQALEQLLDRGSGLTKFERSQIGSLCPDTAEEAKTLVPSLEGKISDDELQNLLEEMMRLRNFVS